jgi:hypothetical protein
LAYHIYISIAQPSINLPRVDHNAPIIPPVQASRAVKPIRVFELLFAAVTVIRPVLAYYRVPAFVCPLIGWGFACDLALAFSPF